MPWGRLEDRYPTSRKIRPLSDKAFRLDVTGILWSCAELTDGQVYDLDDLPAIKNARKALDELVARGRWHEPGHDCKSEYCRPIDEGWLIHDWSEFNQRADRVRADRKARAERQARWRQKARRGGDGRFTGDAAGDALVDAQDDASTNAPRNASVDGLVDPYPPRPAPKEGGAGPRSGPAAGRRPSGPAAGPTPTPPPFTDQPETRLLPPDPDRDRRGLDAVRAALRKPKEAS